MAPSTIKVLLVDDTLVATTLMKRALSGATDIEVVGIARNGREALELIPSLDPAVICTDLHMPVMDGLALTQEIMERFPRPILAVSTSVEEGSLNAFRMMEAGALDIVSKPRIQAESEFSDMASVLITKIRILSGVKVFRKNRQTSSEPGPNQFSPSWPAVGKAVKIVIIGSSTGGPQVLKLILGKLRPSFPLPIVCIQHISLGFLRGLTEWLAQTCRLPVTIARNQEVPAPGSIYFPQEEKHLNFDARGRFGISSPSLAPENAENGDRINSPIKGHVPSVDVTMKSAVEAFGSGVLGILLTGMGNDGAGGMQAISRAGGVTIAQDEKSCTVFGMPKQAIELEAAKFVLSPEKIADFLCGLNSREIGLIDA